MKARGLFVGLLVLAVAGSASAVTVFEDGFETYTANSPLDKNTSGPNAAPNGSGNPWFGPLPPNARVVNTESGIVPHGGSNMIRGRAPTDFDQNWVNIAYRFNGGAPYTGDIALEFWFYDSLGSGGSNLRDFAAIGYYNTAPSDTDYPGSGSLNGSSQIQRLCLGASSEQATGFDSTKYQVRIVGATEGYRNGWFNTTKTRSVGWHRCLIEVGPALPDNTNEVKFYVDDMVTPVFTHNSVTTWGYNVIEVNTNFGSVSGYFDDIKLTRPDPKGACCAHYTCTQTTQAACTEAGGVYKGDGVACAATSCCNTPFADADADQDVDMDDFGAFQACFTGPAGGLLAGNPYPCACFDRNASNGVDLTDFTSFVNCATGPAILWAPSAGCP